MANHPSALKRARQNEKRRLRNRASNTRLRSQIRKLRRAVEEGNLDEAKQLLRPTLSLIDRSVQKGVLHDNAAARRKSRLTRLVQSPPTAGR